MAVSASTPQPPRARHTPKGNAVAFSHEGLAATWCATLVVLSIVWPRYGFFSFGGALKATPFTLLALATWPLCALLFLQPSFSRRLSGSLIASPWLTASFGIWLVWRVFTATAGEQPELSLLIVGRDILYLVPIWLLVIGVASRREGLDALIIAIVVATALVEIIALAQLATGKSFARLIGVQFVGNETFLLGVSEVKFRGGAARLQSAFTHPIVFGQYLSFAAPIVAWTAWKKKGLVRVISILSLIILPLLAWNTGSRAGLLGAGGAIALFFALVALRAARRLTHASALSLLALFILTLAAIGPLHEQAVSIIGGRTAAEASSSLYRSAMYEKGLNAIQESPLTGFGDGRSPNHAGFYGSKGVLTIDSAYLSYLLDNGWIGFFLVIGTWGLLLVSLVRSALRPEIGSEGTSLAAGAAGVMLVFSILSIMDNLSLLFIAAGIAIALRFQYLAQAKALRDRI